MQPRRSLALGISVAVAVPLAFLGSPASAATVSAKPYDFNGDGFPELTIGVPLLQVGEAKAGGVVVLPASKSGLSLNEQILTNDTSDVPGSVKDGAAFGQSVTSADFDRDGFADLAVGSNSGNGTTVTVLFGSAKGLTGARSYELQEQSDQIGDLQVGDFDADGWVDLAVGLPSADAPAGAYANAPGAVRVYRGGANGFADFRVSMLKGERSQPDADLRFGSSLGVGDLNGDGVADLAVGAPGPEGFDDDDEGFRNPGSVSVCYGASGGIDGCTQLLRDFKYAGTTSVTVGNVSGDARPEIVFGVPTPELITDDSGTYEETRVGGAVEILTLSGQGTATKATATELTQKSKGVPGSSEFLDGFGQAVALGDLDRDGFADLVIGAPGEDVGKTKDAGRVTVVYGGSKGYRTSGAKTYDQGTKGIPGKPEKGDNFGSAVTMLDHNADGRLDLAVGAAGEDGSSKTGSRGAVTTLKGSGKSFTTRASSTFTLKTLKYALASESELFGYVLGR